MSGAGLRSKAEKLLDIVCENSYQTSPPFEKLIGDLSGAYSRRINIQHRLVYQILDDEKVVKVIRMWSRMNSWAYRDREEPRSSPLPHHAAYGSVLRGLADQAESGGL